MAWKKRPDRINEWDAWEAEMKSKHPIRFFLQETLPLEFHLRANNYTIYHRIRNTIWAVRHRWDPRHQYNVIRPRTLKPGYHDPRDQILHGVMECLVNYFDNGVPNINWTTDDDHQHAYNEMKAVYDWWMQLWPNKETIDPNGNPLPQYPEKDWTLWDDEDHKVGRLMLDNDDAWYEKENEMLNRIIAVRGFMWFV